MVHTFKFLSFVLFMVFVCFDVESLLVSRLLLMDNVLSRSRVLSGCRDMDRCLTGNLGLVKVTMGFRSLHLVPTDASILFVTLALDNNRSRFVSRWSGVLVEMTASFWSPHLVSTRTSILLLSLAHDEHRGLLRNRCRSRSRRAPVLMDVAELLWSLDLVSAGTTILLLAMAVDEYRTPFGLLRLSNNRVGVLMCMTESVGSLHITIARTAILSATLTDLVLRNSGSSDHSHNSDSGCKTGGTRLLFLGNTS